MATYNLPNGPQGNLADGDIINCSSGAQSITLPPGSYKLECWGAQGGSYSTTYGGKGGYSFGEITLSSITTVYMYAGGQGSGTNSAIALGGGFNGGGNGYSSNKYWFGSGGGASDIRIGTDSLYARVIVAGGGGGCGSQSTSSSSRYAGGYGGGENGGYGSQSGNEFYRAGTGGSQTTAGASYNYGNSRPNVAGEYYALAAFGIGGGVLSGKQSRAAGGGGGWYGGGFSASAGAGGGSGYIYTSLTASDYPSGCLLNSSYYLYNTGTQEGNIQFKSPTNTDETGHAGNGYVRITAISVIKPKYPIYVKVSGAYNKVKDIYVKANGIWNEAKLYVKNDGTWTEIEKNYT